MADVFDKKTVNGAVAAIIKETLASLGDDYACKEEPDKATHISKKTSLITESDVREAYELCRGAMKEFRIAGGTIITPAAKEFLLDRKVRLIASQSRTNAKFKDTSGRGYDKKPEHMTHLHGALLVPKDHPRIVLRGRLDSLQSKIIETQVLAVRCDAADLAEELQSALDYVRMLLRSEVTEEPMRDCRINGMTLEEIHIRSHNPQKYYGTPHVMIDYSMGECAAALNSLRTLTRETEISAFRAFYGEESETAERTDIIEALNRLSSYFYIMILAHLPKNCIVKPSGI